MAALSPLALAALERARQATAKPTSNRRQWTQPEEQLLTQFYPDTPMPALIQRLGFTASAIYQKARSLGLRRSEQYLASESAAAFAVPRHEYAISANVARHIQAAGRREAARLDRQEA